MRNVERLPEPQVLRRHQRRWTAQLLEAIAEAERTNGKVSQTLWNRYNHPKVKECLKQMFSGLCCYCESRVGDVAYENIEHRKPKKRFPDMAFSWSNLHLACPKCNDAKGDNWDNVNEILDAVIDNPIPDHLGYAVTRASVLRDSATERGAVTIIHADLNREDLLQSRQEVFNEACQAVMSIRETQSDEENGSTRVAVAKNELRRWFSREHGSLIEFVAKKLLDEI